MLKLKISLIVWIQLVLSNLLLSQIVEESIRVKGVYGPNKEFISYNDVINKANNKRIVTMSDFNKFWDDLDSPKLKTQMIAALVIIKSLGIKAGLRQFVMPHKINPPPPDYYVFTVKPFKTLVEGYLFTRDTKKDHAK